MSNEYNGWTNWETWQVPLWIDNDECTYNQRIEHRRFFGDWTAESVESMVREYFPNGTPDMNGATDLDAVNWEEIADNWNTED